MEEGGKFESIEKGGSVKGPQKCERSPATARAPDLLSAATLCVPCTGETAAPHGTTNSQCGPALAAQPLGPKRLATPTLSLTWQLWRGGWSYSRACTRRRKRTTSTTNSATSVRLSTLTLTLSLARSLSPSPTLSLSRTPSQALSLPLPLPLPLTLTR